MRKELRGIVGLAALSLSVLALSAGGPAGCGGGSSGGSGGGGGTAGSVTETETNAALTAGLTALFAAYGGLVPPGALALSGSQVGQVEGAVVANIKNAIDLSAADSCSGRGLPSLADPTTFVINGLERFVNGEGTATVSAVDEGAAGALIVDFDGFGGDVTLSTGTVTVVLDGQMGASFTRTSATSASFEIGSQDFTVTVNGGAPLDSSTSLDVGLDFGETSVTVGTEGCVTIGETSFTISGEDEFPLPEE